MCLSLYFVFHQDQKLWPLIISSPLQWTDYVCYLPKAVQGPICNPSLQVCFIEDNIHLSWKLSVAYWNKHKMSETVPKYSLRNIKLFQTGYKKLKTIKHKSRAELPRKATQFPFSTMWRIQSFAHIFEYQSSILLRD